MCDEGRRSLPMYDGQHALNGVVGRVVHWERVGNGLDEPGENFIGTRVQVNHIRMKWKIRENSPIGRSCFFTPLCSYVRAQLYESLFAILQCVRQGKRI